MKVKNEQRIARLESICAQIRADEGDVMETALEMAIHDHDEELAAEIARAIRNHMLDESDSHLAFDRYGIALPDNITATNLLKCFKDLIEGLKSLLNGQWAAYRQALRDLPAQSGFPFDITWPVAPDADQDANE
jgi:hypothetical protein